MAKHNTQNRFVKLAIAASLITTAFSSPLNVAGLVRRDDAAKELKLDAKAFGAAIEGASVNKAGDVYAVDFRGKGATSTSSFGFFHQTSGGVDKVVGQDPIVIAKGSEDTFLAGARFVKGGEKTTVAGEHGDLWTCDGNKATQFSPAILKKADIHRTNGIEVEPKGEFLYLSSAANVKSVVGNLKIFKFALDKETGALLEKDPVVFHDFSHEKDADLDGMRTDVDGNLYVSLNGAGKIAKLDPSGKLLQYITTPGVKGPSNLELGGKDGKTLFAVGRCDNKDKTPGCAASIDVDKPGRAFTSLNA
ncbi:hypothetical protein EMCG_08944 [[Emmonsia] crescens]|uniref:SMP-30/Gluconolactonase/LRE-like region domain-containing protein n=1 Tax=[Emmonsia] crescens TaxID=73230 RepID=A0A0G2I4P9_9EURO|nr:hypothetical protein EMCG_08944 [Emmonsia crescens UAMH 3008]